VGGLAAPECASTKSTSKSYSKYSTSVSIGNPEIHNDELERLKRDHLNSIDRIECYKRRVTYALVAAFLAVGIAISTMAWKFR